MGGERGRESASPLRPEGNAVDVLHVDDDGSFADLVATFLERERDAISVRTETDPQDALAVLEADGQSVDCIVSDYDMPEMDGLEFLERVRDTHPELPFILFTVKGSEEIASEAISSGVTDYLQKGGGTEQYGVLANRVQNAVEGYRAERHLPRGIEAIETAQEGISIIDEDGYFEYANAAYAGFLGYEQAELVGNHWETIYRDEDLDQARETLRVAARDERWSGKTSFVTKGDEDVELQHSLSYTTDGSLVCTLSPTAQEAEGATNAWAKMRAMDEAPIGIVLTDPNRDDNPIVYANDEFTAVTGYEEDEILDRNCRFLQGPETREEPVAKLRTAVENREPVTVELRNYRKDGTEFWNRVRVAPLFDDDGDLDFFVGFQDDVTERKRFERDLKRHGARLEALFEHSPEMIVVHDKDGVILDVNQRLADELGYPQEQLVGETVWDIDPSAEPDRALSFWETMAPNTPHRFEGEFERADGSTFPIEIHLIRLSLEGEDRFVAMDRDISDQKRRERELQEKNERLERFSSVVSHDLRNPIQVATGELTLLGESCDSDRIDAIHEALGRMDDLIDDLLALAQAGEAELELEAARLQDVARTCWGRLPANDATVAIETDRTVRADLDQLNQLLVNLFRNAIEHGGEDVTVTVGDTASGFYVADDGVGLPDGDAADLFDAGYTTADGGTGYGLSIVEAVADRHGWSVAATNGPDGGARFEITTDGDA